MWKSAFTFLLLIAVGLLSFSFSFQEKDREDELIYEGHYQLGNDPCPEWTEANEEPDGTAFEVEWESSSNAKELCLELVQRHVDDNWTIRINDAIVGQLPSCGEPITTYFPVPKGTLLDGTNRLTITTERVSDDIVVGNIRLLGVSYRNKFGVRPVRIFVIDADTQKPIPARITIADKDGNLAPLYYPSQTQVPNRVGVAYTTMNGKATLEVGAGNWVIWASRGTEWSVDSAPMRLGPLSPDPILLELKREVDTTGYVACDTHIHTLEFSGHGDASTWERVHTLAGEGVELAIATDHNHHTDYRPRQKEIGATSFFTPVVGNEVSASWGHFNAFPFALSEGEPGLVKPDWNIKEWLPLVADIRAKGAKVVILNHPRWPSFDKSPFGKEWQALDRETGTFGSGLKELGVDGIEIFNSTTAVTTWEEVLLDWFALLNRGMLVYGVGSSDSHTVGDSVGQGRTYVRGIDSNPGSIDVDEMCQSFIHGHTSMSLGLYLETKVNGKAPSHTTQAYTLSSNRISYRIAAASWADVNSLTLYANGKAIDSIAFEDSTIPVDFIWSPNIQLNEDAWLVCVAEGDKPKGAFWQSVIPNLGAVTNPIWVAVE